MFPSNIIASFMSIENYELFEWDKAAQVAPSAKDLFANK
jgi:hypothetical protein